METLNRIISYIIDNPEMGYGAILASLQSRISQEDWEKLDKSSLDKMNQHGKKFMECLVESEVYKECKEEELRVIESGRKRGT